MTLVFQVNQTQDYCAEIHIRTSPMNDIIRVPVYYHVHSDRIKFTPTVLDFGIVPLNFEMLKLQVKGKSRAQENLMITDIFVPISDSRLDFLMIEPKTMIPKKDVVTTNSEFFFGYVLLNPNSPGLLQQKIIFNAVGEITNQTYKIELPIIANVLNDSLVLQYNS